MAGSSGLDANVWKRMCTSFKSASSELCSAVASVTKRMGTEELDPKSLGALLACQLIAFNKNPGVRLIGIGKTSTVDV